MGVVAIAGAAVGVAKVLGIGGDKPTSEKAQNFASSIYADLQAGKPGALSAIQFRASPTYPWMLDPTARPIMLQLVSTVISAGYAKASDFDRTVVQAAGGLQGLDRPGAGVAPDGTPLTGAATLQARTAGLPMWAWLAVAALAVGGGLWWFLKRRRR